MTIVPMSEKMKKLPSGRKPADSDYKWREIEVGQSFIIDANKLKYQSLVSMAFKMSKQLGRVFKVIRHDGQVTINNVVYPHGIYEVGRFENVNQSSDAEFEKMED